jgi:acyl-coenzyme A thioesterase PaaI-like protein
MEVVIPNLPRAASLVNAVPFRLPPARLQQQLQQFNARGEILWFGFEGDFRQPGSAMVRFTRLEAGAQGGGGTAAVNGGVIAAGFDAAFVLAGLGQYDTDVVVTLELSVKFLSLARVSPTLAFQAHVVRSAKNFSFAEGFLADAAVPDAPRLAIATAMVAPAQGQPDGRPR